MIHQHHQYSTPITAENLRTKHDISSLIFDSNFDSTDEKPKDLHPMNTCHSNNETKYIGIGSPTVFNHACPIITGAIDANVRTDSSMPSTQNQTTSTPESRKRWICPICFKRFIRPSSLQQHIRAHTGEKPFQCTYANCGRRFSILSNLRRHQRLHERDGNPTETLWRSFDFSNLVQQQGK
jgi:hypothetical protein